MMIPRRIAPRLRELLSQFPAVALLGPRQACEDVKAKRRFVVYPGQDRFRVDRATEAVPLTALLQDGWGE